LIKEFSAMKKALVATCIGLLTGFLNVAHADDPAIVRATSLADACQMDVKGDKKDEWKRLPKAESSVTRHGLSVAGKSIEYTATSGTLVIRDDDDKPMANLGYIAYPKLDVNDLSQQPVLFAFNGGPGSSSIWLHMGALGPRRVVVSDPGPTPPAPYRTVENEFGVLVLCGYYDLAIPFSATEYVMSHLGVPPGVPARIQLKYYEAGHMMYVHPPSLKKMKADLDAFIDATMH
jgi:carboxypeptidase C (cathepsin A)